MAAFTEELSRLARVGAVLTWTWDDAGFVSVPKGSVLDQPLVSFDLVCTDAVHITIWRTGNTPWREFTVPAGTYSYPSGGPVQRTSDISYIYLGTV